jgi:hypothetical protein
MGLVRYVIGSIGILIVILSFSGCATTCDKMTIKYQNHPELAHPAKTIVFKCGEKKVKWNVEKPPKAACMAQCFEGSSE